MICVIFGLISSAADRRALQADLIARRVILQKKKKWKYRDVKKQLLFAGNQFSQPWNANVLDYGDLADT